MWVRGLVGLYVFTQVGVFYEVKNMKCVGMPLLIQVFGMSACKQVYNYVGMQVCVCKLVFNYKCVYVDMYVFMHVGLYLGMYVDMYINRYLGSYVGLKLVMQI